MKRILTTAIAFLLTLTLSAQSNITTFMGIPVDGTKAAMTAYLLKNGAKRQGKDLIFNSIDGNPYIIRLMTNKGRVWRVSMVDGKGTKNVEQILGIYEEMIDSYRANETQYCEYEYNKPVDPAHEQYWENFIHQGAYYAEFFQVSDPQLYSRRVAFRITDEFGDYRIERLYDNVYNLPEGEQ